MADDPAAPNTISPGVRDRSVAEGDVPEHLRRRYYVDGRGGAGLGFYVDAQVKAPAFRDQGRQLIAARSDPNAVRDMTAIAQHRGWSIVVARGAAGFRREAWLAGRAVGIEVRGYRPTERDVQELDRRTAARDRRESATGNGRGRGQRHDRAGPDVDTDPGARVNLGVVEAVIRARVADRPAQERILLAARDRIANWLERGARIEPLRVLRATEPIVERHPHRERNRGR